MKKALDLNNPSEVVASVREFLEESKAIYQGWNEKLPDSIKAQVKQLTDKVATALTLLASKPADPAAAVDVSQTRTAILALQDSLAATMDALQKLVAEFLPKSTALTVLQGRIDKQELLEATEVEKRVNQAKEDTRKAERERIKLLNSRRTVLAKADLPLPLEDETLEGDDKAFEALKTKTAERTTKLKDLGLVEAMNAQDLSEVIYGADVIFNALTKKAEALGKTKSQEADPMLGAGTSGKPRRLCIA